MNTSNASTGGKAWSTIASRRPARHAECLMPDRPDHNGAPHTMLTGAMCLKRRHSQRAAPDNSNRRTVQHRPLQLATLMIYLRGGTIIMDYIKNCHLVIFGCMVEWSNTTDLKSGGNHMPDLTSVPERGPGSNPGATDFILLGGGHYSGVPACMLKARLWVGRTAEASGAEWDRMRASLQATMQRKGSNASTARVNM
jgi:hypothetical protein